MWLIVIAGIPRTEPQPILGLLLPGGPADSTVFATRRVFISRRNVSFCSVVTEQKDELMMLVCQMVTAQQSKSKLCQL